MDNNETWEQPENSDNVPVADAKIDDSKEQEESHIGVKIVLESEDRDVLVKTKIGDMLVDIDFKEVIIIKKISFHISFHAYKKQHHQYLFFAKTRKMLISSMNIFC